MPRPAPLTVARYFRPATLYRLAVVGGTGAGKTSLLAALGMTDRPPHPQGYTAVRLDRLPGLAASARPAGDPDGWAPEELRRDPVRAFLRADRWLAQAARELSGCRQPRPNEAAHPPLLAVYTFRAPEHGEMTVELVEFAGELLRAEAPADNRARLDDYLRTVDGLVVLADAPHPGRPPAALGEDLQILQAALAAWATGRRAGTRVGTPVALVFNKWDRRGGPAATPDERQAEVAALLAESSAHQQLQLAVSGLTDRWKVFAVSAYGRHHGDRDTPGVPLPNTDRPAAYPLPAFGLEDPFVWACQQADAALAEDVRRRTAGLSWRSPHRTWAAWRLWADGRRLAARLPSGDPARAEAATAARRAGRTAGTLTAGWAALAVAAVVAVGVGAERHVDRPALAAHLAALDDPTTSQERYDASREWLDGYAASGWFRHQVSKWVVEPADVRDRLARTAAAREETAWSAVVQAPPDPTDNCTAAVQTPPGPRERAYGEYLKWFPGGQHASEARRWLDAAEDRRRACEAIRRLRAERREAVGRVRAAFARAHEDVPQLRQVRTDFQNLPPVEPGVETDADVAARIDLGKEINEQYATLTKNDDLKHWVRVKADVDRRVNALDLQGAARELRSCTVKLSEVDEARRGFGAAAVAAADRAVTARIAERAWDESLSRLAAAQTDPDFAALTDRADRDRLGHFVLALKRAKDRALYDDFRLTQTPENARRYLDTAPLKAMKKTVDEYLKWDADRHEPQAVKVWWEVVWANWADGVSNAVTVSWIDPAKQDSRADIQAASIGSAAGQNSDWFESDSFNYRPAAPIRFRFVVERNGFVGPFSDRLKADYEMPEGRTLEELARQTEVDLVQRVGSDRQARVRFRAVVPARPAVGEWKED